LNWTDYIIIGILGLSVLIGLFRGLVSEVLALLIWAVAFWVAWMFGPLVAAQFEGLIRLPSGRAIAGYGLCFVVVLVFGAILRFVVRRLVEGTGLSGTDRLLGMLFGFARGVLVVTLLVFLAGFTPLTRDPWWQRSLLLPEFQHVAAWLEQRVPASLRDHLHPSAVLDRLPSLPTSVRVPISSARSSFSGGLPVPAASSSSIAPAPAHSAATDPQTF
jgi:membrane protein required for colicin V production